MISDKLYEAFQVLTIYKDECTKLHNDILSNIEEKIVEKIKNKSAEIMKEAHAKKVDHKGVHFKNEILS